jgi:hypothetical protein
MSDDACPTTNIILYQAGSQCYIRKSNLFNLNIPDSQASLKKKYNMYIQLIINDILIN